MKFAPFALAVVSACAGSTMHYTNPIGTPVVPIPSVKVTTSEEPKAFQQAMEGFDYTQALAIAQAWLKRDPKSIYAALAIARASCALADMSTNEAEVDVHVERALTTLDAFKDNKATQPSIVTLNVAPLPVWHFHYAEATALRARWKGTAAITMLHTIASHGEEAVKLASGYDDAAPLRLLGMLLIKAPPWPAGPGDDERGKELIEAALQLAPQRAEAHIHRADMFLDESRMQDAVKELRHGRELAGKNPRAQKLANEVEMRVKTTQGVKRY